MSKDIERLGFLEYFQKGNKIVGVRMDGDMYEVLLYDTVTKKLTTVEDEYPDIEGATEFARKYYISL
jgi:hypothetical protein